MQVMTPQVAPDMTGKTLPAVKSVADALNVVAKGETAEGAAEGVKPGFDNTLATLMTTLNSDTGRQKIGEKITEAVEQQQAETPEGTDDSAAMAILESLLTASQHPVKSLPVKGNSEKPEHKVNTVMLQSREASVQSASAQGQAQVQTQPLLQGQTQQGNSQANTTVQETHGTSVKLVATRPVAATTQEMAQINASQSVPMSAESTSVASAQEIAAQPTTAGDKNARFTLPDVKLSDENSRWSEQLHSALGDRLQVQMKDKIQHATIRLDPPNMGKIDISMQLENGRMQVHINASHGDVYRALQQVSHDLRQTLVEQNFVQVNVQVSSQHPGQQQGNRQQASADQNDTVFANAELPEDDTYSSHQDDESVLLTV